MEGEEEGWSRGIAGGGEGGEVVVAGGGEGVRERGDEEGAGTKVKVEGWTVKKSSIWSHYPGWHLDEHEAVDTALNMPNQPM